MGADQRAWHAISVEEASLVLSTSIANGLTESEAKNRLKKAGPNTIRNKKRSLPIRDRRNWNALLSVLTLLLCATISLALHRNIEASLLTLSAFAHGSLVLGQWMRRESPSSTRLVPSKSRVLREHQWRLIPTWSLVPGDVVQLRRGDKVPADIRLTSGEFLLVREENITGRRHPSEKEPAPLQLHTPLAERKNMLFAGSRIASGSPKGIVVTTGPQSELGKLVALLTSTSHRHPHIGHVF